jgi:hypothetical protein
VKSRRKFGHWRRSSVTGYLEATCGPSALQWSVQAVNLERTSGNGPFWRHMRPNAGRLSKSGQAFDPRPMQGGLRPTAGDEARAADVVSLGVHLGARTSASASPFVSKECWPRSKTWSPSHRSQRNRTCVKRSASIFRVIVGNSGMIALCDKSGDAARTKVVGWNNLPRRAF